MTVAPIGVCGVTKACDAGMTPPRWFPPHINGELVSNHHSDLRRSIPGISSGHTGVRHRSPHVTRAVCDRPSEWPHQLPHCSITDVTVMLHARGVGRPNYMVARGCGLCQTSKERTYQNYGYRCPPKNLLVCG